jgi:FkbM family methyltransferase
MVSQKIGAFLSGRVFPACNRFAMHRLKHSVFLKSLLYRILWLLPESFREQNAVRDALKALARTGKPVFFVNIGANDGLAGDPLREFITTRGWRGMLVEPVDYVFQRLVKAYRRVPDVILENRAIADLTGEKLFWYVRKNTELPAGYDQFGSFIKSQVLKQASNFPGLERFLDSRIVSCITLPDLLARHGIQRVNLFLIDTEGYDLEIVKQIDLRNSPPEVIIFENVHLVPMEREACYESLRAHGYTVSEANINTVAVRSLPEQAGV